MGRRRLDGVGHVEQGVGQLSDLLLRPHSTDHLEPDDRAAADRLGRAFGQAIERPRNRGPFVSGVVLPFQRYAVSMEALLDRLGRPLETLRVSITDRCNFRCVYRMPKEVFGRDHVFLERRELLSLERLPGSSGSRRAGRTHRCDSRG